MPANAAPYRVFTNTGKRAHRAARSNSGALLFPNGQTLCGAALSPGREEDSKLRMAPMCYRCEFAYQKGQA